MQEKKIAFVSSYDESCGIATFTRALVDSINEVPGWKAECVKLDPLFTQSQNRRGRALGDRHIRQIAAQLKDFDAVNIQCEYGLYGTTPAIICKRLDILAQAHPRLSVTMHTLSFGGGGESWIKLVSRLAGGLLNLKPAKALAEFHGNWSVRGATKMSRRALRVFMRHAVPIIVHTERSRRYIKHFFGYDNVRTHPLKYLPAGFRPDILAIKALRKHMGFDGADKIIGIFGFVTPYKGHDDALAALALLPKNYKLLVFGRQHPRSIKHNAKDQYVAKLLIAVDKYKLRDRVFFMGEVLHDDFINMAASVDACWLPYYENGQDGSGIASICLDVAPRVLCSAAFVFDELLRLSPYCNVLRFDIGNYRELASKTELILNCDAPPRPYGAQNYTLETQASLYLETLAAKE
jgi:glycosyltransferase involved in cell wall biosynthesis